MNPFKFGFNGTTDTHTAIPTTREDNYFGKYQHTEPSPNRQNVDVIPADDPALRIVTAQEGAARLTAVWARETPARKCLARLPARKLTPPPEVAFVFESSAAGTSAMLIWTHPISSPEGIPE